MRRHTPTLLLTLALLSACAFDRAPAALDEDLGQEHQDLSSPDQPTDDPNLRDLPEDTTTSDFSKDFGQIEDADSSEDASEDQAPDLPAWTREQCLEACQRLQSCVGQVCDLSQQGDPEATLETCAQGCLSDESFQQQLEQVRLQSCGQTNADLCRGAEVRQTCQCPPPNLGAPCDQGQGCFTTAAPAVCLQSAGPLDFPGGYCTVLDCVDDPDCDGGDCINLAISDQMRRICVDRCAVAAPDCREGYGCWALDQQNQRGACFPACAPERCGAGQVCFQGGCVQQLPCDEQTPCEAGVCVNGICLTP